MSRLAGLSSAPIRQRRVAMALTLVLMAAACGEADLATSGSSSSTASVDDGDTPLAEDASSSFDPQYLDTSPAGWFPPLDDPEFVPASEADWLTDEDVVLGVVRGGMALALPVSQMSFHHIANLDIDGEPYLVTY